MILSLSVCNYLSFKDEVTFSFEASKEKELEEEHVIEITKGVRLLKFGIVYGYNASGKSNLISAFDFLSDFWFNTVENKKESIGLVPFRLDADHRDKPTSFKLVFYVGETKYLYLVQILGDIVKKEKLQFYPGTQPAIIFSRIDSNGISLIEFGNKIKVNQIAKDEITIKCLSNISVFSAYNQVNTRIKEVDLAIEWMATKVMNSIGPTTIMDKFTEELISEDSFIKHKILNYLKEADFNISNILSEVKEEKVPEGFIQRAKAIGLPDSEIEILERERTIRITNTEFEHKVINEGKEETYRLDIEEQSAGTKRLFGLSGAIFKTIERNAFLPIDELEAKLHPRLIKYVIEKFLKDSENSQLLVTTHYDSLFDETSLLRKDNFWFTEKQNDGSTKLYPLTDFKGLNRISSLQKAYKKGSFGATPSIK